jgi:hypothetical protein
MNLGFRRLELGLDSKFVVLRWRLQVRVMVRSCRVGLKVRSYRG